MVINKKVRRTILESKSQYIGSMILIIVSCLLFTMMNLLADNMSTMTSRFEKDCLQEDASFVTTSKLEKIPELESGFHAMIEESASFDYMLSEGKKLRIFRSNAKINLPAIVEGNPLKGGDILLDPSFAKANKLEIGGRMTVGGTEFRIAGYTALPNYIYQIESENDLISNPESFGIAVLGSEDFNRFHSGTAFYSIRFASDTSEKKQAAVKFRDYLKQSGTLVVRWTDTSENARVIFVTAKIQGISKISTSMPIAILLLTCVLTGIVMRRLLKRESVIIGTLYAQGYRKREIILHYMRYPILVALAGGIAGTLLGALLLRPMLDFMISYFNIPVTATLFNPGYLFASLLLPVLFLTAGSWIVLGKELDRKPAELMKGNREDGKVNFLERLLKLEKFRFPTKFRLREQLRSMPRLLFLLIGVAMATILLLFGLTAKSSMDFLLKDNLKDTYRFQYEYVFNSIQTGQVPDSAEPFSASVFSLKTEENDRFEICGIEPASTLLSLKDWRGKELPKNQVIITKPLADKLKVGPGDAVTALNKLDSREYTVIIESIAYTYIGEYIFMPVAQYNKMLGLPQDSFTGLWSTSPLNIPENRLYRSRTIEDSIKAFLASTESLQAAIGTIAFLSFLIGLIAVYVVTSMIIEENKNSISLMKILGYRRKEVNSLILNSSSYIVFLGYLLGIPLVMALMNVLFVSLTDSINLTVPVAVNYAYLLAGLVVIFLTYEVSKVLSRRKVNRITMGEALKAGAE